MKYDPESLIAELDEYQQHAQTAFEDGVIEDLSRFPDGAKRARDQRLMAPDKITIDTIDDVLPLTLVIEETTYNLTAINGGQATYTGG